MQVRRYTAVGPGVGVDAADTLPLTHRGSHGNLGDDVAVDREPATIRRGMIHGDPLAEARRRTSAGDSAVLHRVDRVTARPATIAEVSAPVHANVLAGALAVRARDVEVSSNWHRDHVCLLWVWETPVTGVVRG